MMRFSLAKLFETGMVTIERAASDKIWSNKSSTLWSGSGDSWRSGSINLKQ